MTDRETKREILEALAELVERAEGLRFGQLVANLAVIARGPVPEAVWDVEDGEMLEAIRSHVEDYRRRRAGAGGGGVSPG